MKTKPALTLFYRLVNHNYVKLYTPITKVSIALMKDTAEGLAEAESPSMCLSFMKVVSQVPSSQMDWILNIPKATRFTNRIGRLEGTSSFLVSLLYFGEALLLPEKKFEPHFL